MKFAILLLTILFSLNAQTTWQNSGLGNFIYSIASDSSGNVFAFEDQACMKYNYLTESWDSVGSINDSNYRSFGLMSVGDVLFSSGYTSTNFSNESGEHNIYRSVDGGITWVSHSDGINSKSIEKIHYGKDKILYAVGSIGLYKSTDLGSNWTKINQDPDSVRLDMITTTSNGYIYTGNNRGQFFRSMDGGVTLTEIDSGMTVKTFYYHLVTTNDDEIYLPSVCYIYKSTDYGNYWYDIIDDSFPIEGCFEFTSIFIKGNIIIAGTGSDSNEFIGVLISYDLGNTWSALTDGLPYKTDVVSILLDDKGYIHIGTHQDGSYRTASPITSIEEEDGELPGDFFLAQNYPNPFNPTTTIKFSTPYVGRSGASPYNTKIIAYDILGREIKTLINNNLSPGNYEVEFDGTDLPSGIYFYKLTSGDYRATRKMLLVK